MLADNLICQECDIIYSSKSKLNRHIREKHSQKTPKLKCPTCFREFKRKYHLDRHIRTKHKKKYFNCQKCVCRFVEKYKLKKHYKNSHCLDYCTICEKLVDSQCKTGKCRGKEYVCQFDGCGKVFKKKDFYERHVDLHRKEVETTSSSVKSNLKGEIEYEKSKKGDLCKEKKVLVKKLNEHHESNEKNSFEKLNFQSSLTHSSDQKKNLNFQKSDVIDLTPIFKKNFFSKPVNLKLKRDKNLKRIKKHETKMKYLCPVQDCLKTFSFHKNLIKHLKNH